MCDLGAWLSSVGMNLEMNRSKPNRLADGNSSSIAAICAGPSRSLSWEDIGSVLPPVSEPHKRKWRRPTLVLPLYL
jgi:hypothetical protein